MHVYRNGGGVGGGHVVFIANRTVIIPGGIIQPNLAIKFPD